MPVAGALIGAAGSIAGGAMGARGAKSAARAQQAADMAAIDEQRRQFDTIQEMQRPFQQTGVASLNQLSQLYGLQPPGGGPAAPPDLSSFYQSPDYQFRFNEGNRAIQQSAAARGGAFSGNTGRALADYAGNLASGEFGNYANRLASMAGIGQTATNVGSQAASQAGGNIAQLLQAGGDARASGILGGANSMASGINNGINNAISLYEFYRRGNSGGGGDGLSYFTPTASRRY